MCFSFTWSGTHGVRRRAFMRTIAVAAILFAALSLCADGAQAAPWCAQYNTGLNECHFYFIPPMHGCAFRERRNLLAEFIRESILDWQGLAKAPSARLLGIPDCQCHAGSSDDHRPQKLLDVLINLFYPTSIYRGKEAKGVGLFFVSV